jgi:hypothetical protein
MSLVRFFAPQNPLGKAIAIAGGKHIDKAIADAEEQILLAADESIVHIDQTLEEVYRLSSAGKGQWDTLYKRVREVAGLAGVCGLEDLGTAALSFCTMLDQATQTGQLSDDQMQVQVGVLRLLRHPERFSADERAKILENLQAMMDKTKRDFDLANPG